MVILNKLVVVVVVVVIDPVACILVFFKGKSFSGLEDRPINVAAPKL